MTFQSQVNVYQAPAVEGDFASINPRAVALAGEGELVAGATGVTTGRFAWAVNGVVSNAGTGVPSGFVHREQQALITSFLGETSNVVPQGLPVTLYTRGDYWVKCTVAAATKGQKVFASLTDGSAQPGNAGATIAGFIETPFVVANTGVAIGELIKMTTWS